MYLLVAVLILLVALCFLQGQQSGIRRNGQRLPFVHLNVLPYPPWLIFRQASSRHLAPCWKRHLVLTAPAQAVGLVFGMRAEGRLWHFRGFNPFTASCNCDQ